MPLLQLGTWQRHVSVRHLLASCMHRCLQTPQPSHAACCVGWVNPSASLCVVVSWPAIMKPDVLCWCRGVWLCSLDDATYATLSSLMLFNNVDVVLGLYQDAAFLPRVSPTITVQQTRCSVNSCSALLLEYLPYL